MYNNLKELWPKEWPSRGKWKYLPRVLNKKEKIIFSGMCLVFLISGFFLLLGTYYSQTEVVPGPGGIYREGFVKSSRWLTINPLYASHSDAERDIIEVGFDELMRYEDGELVPRLAESYEVTDNRIFEIELRDDIYWSNGEKITSQDVLFTVGAIQNPAFQSTLRQQWTGVKTEKLSERKVRFTLDSPSAVFAQNLTLKIIPEHIFKDTTPQNLRYDIHNMQFVGSGPYRYKDFEEDEERIKSITLERNPYYVFSDPFINEVVFLFYESESDLLEAQRKGEIDGFTPSRSMQDYQTSLSTYEFFLPRYFSVIFNLEQESVLEDHNIRKALNYATDKEEILRKVLNNKGTVVDSPILPSFYGITPPEKRYDYNPEKAKELISSAGFVDGIKVDEDPFRFTEDLKEGSQGEEVRNLQRCFISIEEDFYPEGEVTGFFGSETKEAVNRFQEFYFEDILAPHGFTKGTGMVAGSTREKLNELCADIFKGAIPLEISVTTINDPTLVELTEVLKEQWEKVGINLIVKAKDVQRFTTETIPSRDYESLLLGTTLTAIPNPLPLWHSTKREEPGINLSGYENETVDELTEIIIKKTGEEREEALLQLQELILEDAPGIFLYNPSFSYYVSPRIKGIEEGKLIDASKRLKNIDKWYIATRRTF